MISGGEFRHRIDLQRMVERKNEQGEAELDAVTYASSVPCRVTQTTGREFVNGQKVSAESSHMIELRWMPNVSPRDRVLYDGRTLELESVVSQSRRRELVLMAKEVV
ncbi:MAG: phage head closure protein [Planctomycetes bacterium]|jgi:SPP1 family predicted phage head-tail adaptor|nr:phage head closure protein [Planctomycetota bacterium]OQZ06341.1 MAG: hypothetical protein B6D36_05545 [Planctomycetes bacterium UTPLA1]